MDLVIPRIRLEPLEVAARDPGDLLLHLTNSHANPVSNEARDGRHEAECSEPQGKRRGCGLLPCLPPTGFGIKHQKRRLMRTAAGPLQRHREIARV